MNRTTTKPSSLRAPSLSCWTLALTLLGLAACGGGGSGNGNTGVVGGGSSGSMGGSGGSTAVPAAGGGNGSNLPSGVPPFVPGMFQPSALFANQCARPRMGTDPNTGQPFPDRFGSVVLENHFLRSRANETYLWYRDIQDQNPALFADPLAYFDTLKTMAVTPSGRPQDQFHFTIPTAEFDSFSIAGVQADYGFRLALQVTPTEIIAQIIAVEPNAPALVTTALGRGDRLLSIDGINASNPSSQAEIDSLNAALSPQAGESHSFVFAKRGTGVQQTLTLTAANITSTPVQKAQLIPGTTVGYLLFNDHIATAEDGLVSAITTLQNAGATELVLDIRYNGGGLLAIASELAFMIAGPGPTAGRSFERLVFNDKNPSTNPVTGEPLTPLPFFTQTLGFSVAPNTPLPSLNLQRVFVLTTGDTCSASESIINSLRGVDVQVVQIGSTTCGKPFGFFPEPNCGTTYFSIQFQGVNAKNFGDYPDGFTPANASDSLPRGVLVDGCAVADDLSRDLGDPNEAMLATALGFISGNGACPAPSSDPLATDRSQLGVQSPSIQRSGMFRSPRLENRWLR